jgi:hypothetical protein
MDER